MGATVIGGATTTATSRIRYKAGQQSGLVLPAVGTSGVNPVALLASYGAWLQLAAGSLVTEDVLLATLIVQPNGSQPSHASVQIGVGGAGAEVAVAEVRATLITTGAGGLPQVDLPPVLIPAGSRVAVRAAGDGTNVPNLILSIATRRAAAQETY